MASSARSGPSASKDIDNSASHSSSRPSESSGEPAKQAYPLYPSVAQLLRERKISASDAEKIPATGPKGRLLKGDVLAYLGEISASYPSDQSARISKLGHLDLSNIQIASPKNAETSTPSRTPAAKAPVLEPDTKVTVKISLKAVLEVQKRVQSTLGITLPLSTFIARAAKAANHNLPRPSSHTPSADELFNQIVGLDTVHPKVSQGTFLPQILALPANSTASMVPQGDIIDELTPSRPSSSAPSRKPLGPAPELISGTGSETGVSIFSVSAKKGDEKRAKVFLERIKTILQVEPGTLVL